MSTDGREERRESDALDAAPPAAAPAPPFDASASAPPAAVEGDRPRGPRGNAPICRDFCRNRCTKPVCRFSHPTPEGVAAFRLENGWDKPGQPVFSGGDGRGPPSEGRGPPPQGRSSAYYDRSRDGRGGYGGDARGPPPSDYHRGPPRDRDAPPYGRDRDAPPHADRDHYYSREPPSYRARSRSREPAPPADYYGGRPAAAPYAREGGAGGYYEGGGRPAYDVRDDARAAPPYDSRAPYYADARAPYADAPRDAYSDARAPPPPQQHYPGEYVDRRGPPPPEAASRGPPPEYFASRAPPPPPADYYQRDARY